MMLTLDFAAESAMGPRRENEDSGCAGPGLLAVADGVGGSAGGAVASSVAITSLIGQRGDGPVAGHDAGLRRAFEAANRGIADAVASARWLAGMATTLTAVATAGDGTLCLAHIGDSRAYLLRTGKFVQLSRDQTLVQALIDDGSITPEQAREHPLRSHLLSALRGRAEDLADVQVTTWEAQAGDRLLLCSDGLSSYVPVEAIRTILDGGSAPREAAASLVEAALAAATHDNVTVVVARVSAGRVAAEPLRTVGALATRETPAPGGA
jgi:protein phosphatase